MPPLENPILHKIGTNLHPYVFFDFKQNGTHRSWIYLAFKTILSIFFLERV